MRNSAPKPHPIIVRLPERIMTRLASAFLPFKSADKPIKKPFRKPTKTLPKSRFHRPKNPPSPPEITP
jgi:hypothetical protein